MGRQRLRLNSLAAVFRSGSQVVEAAELAAIADAGGGLGGAAGGLEIRPGVGLAQRRGESEPSQPVADGDLLLVADARLDNRRELAPRLGRPVADGAGDPELLLAAYRTWGEDFVGRLVGDFAFVLWDRRRRRLVCARDALGLRPLHYARAGSALAVASEAHQLLAHPEIPRGLDQKALVDYLLNRRPAPSATMFEGVRALPPGHLLVADEAGERLVRFWDPAEMAVPAPASAEEAGARFREVFDRAVGDRTEDCGPACGVLLSGGLDSSSVAAAAAEAVAARSAAGQLVLYHGSFEGLERCDERPWVDALTARLGLPVERIPAEPDGLLPGPGLTSWPESPFVGWQGLQETVLRRLRRRGGRVLLTGHGGDAVAAGSALVYADRLRRADLGVLREIREHGGASGAAPVALLAHWGVLPLLPAALQRGRAARRARAGIPDWIDPEFARRVGLEERLRDTPPRRRPRSLARAAIREQIEHLDGVLRVVHWSRRLAASHGIEVRHPFLDRRLVELVLATPPRMLFRAGSYKQLLRAAMAGRLPGVIRERRGKAAFGPYLDACWRERGVRAVGDLLRLPALGKLGIVRPERVRRAYRDYVEGRSVSLRNYLWSIITLESWLDRHWGDGMHLPGHFRDPAGRGNQSTDCRQVTG